jgi:transcriptional regulator with XRE-family HTH domain
LAPIFRVPVVTDPHFMKTKNPPLKHGAMAEKLGVSRSYVSRLHKLGMPLHSPEAARRWIQARANETGVSAAATLVEQRREKIRLECALLSLRLEREQANAEMLPAAQCVATVKLALRFALLALKARCEEFAESLAATTRPQEAVPILRRMVSEGWLTGAVGMLAQGAPEPRLANAIVAMVRGEFAGVTDEQLSRWMDALCADEQAKWNAGLVK